MGMRKAALWAAVAMVTSATTLTFAQDAATTEAPPPPPAPAKSSALEGAYIGGLGFVYLTDSSRDYDSGGGARALFGYPISKSLNVEISGYGQNAESDSGPRDDLDGWGVGVDAMFPFTQGRLRPFGLIGAGYQRDEAGFDKEDNGYVNLGLGALFALGRGFDLRAEARYVPVFTGSGSADESRYDDGQLGLGLQYTFQPPKPDTIVYVAAPAAAVAAPIVDTDGDNVPDSADKCPNTPKGVQVNEFGCPLDTDGDGVPDYLDKCPNTPRGMKVDAKGCVGGAQTFLLRDVNFEFDSDKLTANSTGILDNVVGGLKGQTGLQIEVAGHTDAKGSDAYNLALSKRRAASVKNYLISRGIAAGQLDSRGYGEKQPVATNETDEGRAQNRRVELRIQDKPQ